MLFVLLVNVCLCVCLCLCVLFAGVSVRMCDVIMTGLSSLLSSIVSHSYKFLYLCFICLRAGIWFEVYNKRDEREQIASLTLLDIM